MDPCFANSAFTWIKDLPPGRNQFVSFQREFFWKKSDVVSLALFADTRFRLFVNEVFIAYGPARFVTQFAEFDRFDLTPHLHPGTNTIRVEVNFYGTSSYQSMPDGRPGFIAAGGTADGRLDLSTPGDWRAILHQAWDPQAPLFSFAQNPCEILDTRTLAEELASPASASLTTLPDTACPWTTLCPRSVPYPDYHPIHPVTLRLAAPAQTTFERIGVRMTDPDFQSEQRKDGEKLCFQVATWIHSPRDQQVNLESFWSDAEINGTSLTLDQHTLQGNHGTFAVSLQQGWNLFCAQVEQLTEHWSYLLGWPAEKGLSLHARPDLGEPAPWALSPLQTSQSLPSPPDMPGDCVLPNGWKTDSGDLMRITPARHVAWETPLASHAIQNLPWPQRKEADTLAASTAIWTLDFADQFYGHPVVEVEAPAGSILDIGYDDWIRSDGCVNLYHSNPFTDAVDRYILRGGRQRIEVLNPRGGIFLQVVVRTPNGEPTDLTLHDLLIRSRQTLASQEACTEFDCDNPTLNWAWRTAVHTLAVSTDEAYADCPWRERGSYIGDSLVNLHLHRLLSADLSIARRTLRMMGNGQHCEGPRKGQLASVTPAWHRYGHDDFTLIWILALKDYSSLSGDMSLAGEMWPIVMRIWDSPVWHSNPHGLWDVTPDMRPFIDWGVQTADRTGRSNLLLNLFRVGALQATAELATRLDRDPAPFHAQVHEVSSALIEQLWQEDRSRFAASEEDNTAQCLHGQVLALLFGVGDANRLLTTLTSDIRGNLEQGIQQGQNSGHLELYFQFYLLQALERVEGFDLAEKMIQDHFSFLRDLGYPTLPEGFCRAHSGHGSCCHSWSGYAAVYATRNILGLRQAVPGATDTWILDPRTESYTRASGTLPHKRGLIRVSWTRQHDHFHASIQAPPGVTVLQKHQKIPPEKRE